MEEQWGWAAWLTGLDLAVWLVVTLNLKLGFSSGLVHTHAQEHRSCMHLYKSCKHVEIEKCTHVCVNPPTHTHCLDKCTYVDAINNINLDLQ